MSIKTKSALATSLLAYGIFSSSYALSVECYDTIYTPTLLVEDLICPPTPGNPYALTIVGPFGSLRMLGAGKLTCTLGGVTGNGILMEGVSASVINGKIESCSDGISVKGLGNHTILNSNITDFTNNGIIISSSFNFMQGNEIVGLGEAGAGLGNGVGLFIESESNYNAVNNNFISTTYDDAIQVDGKHTTITLNEIIDIQRDGINLLMGSGGATVTGNFISFTDDDGIQVLSDSNFISNNIVTEINDDGILIAEDSTGNLIRDNTVNKNRDGIINFNGTGNTIEDNTVMNNSGFDLRDFTENMTCTNQLNTWANNDVGIDGTSDPECLKDQ
ncbi:right-handed parallel beta-helix repeat-containing protein [Microbulbifer sp. GL-2]|uniref:right-handed parallel beta-helix repeat-containing protein n=1 Tax=Microbulbifer sp. GL-2 TaxID=2591606 RepID=UPI001163CBE5|nr:right-handed parallel beta-helix repeat-containing protein [Microbulbifer sp. GL-2]BBM04196.1 hypothetical protein GL2_42700 [Microbulbifer sp. GL-2]